MIHLFTKMIVLFIIVTLDFEYKGQIEKFTLNTGKYRVHSIGSQGGFSYENGKKRSLTLFRMMILVDMMRM